MLRGSKRKVLRLALAIVVLSGAVIGVAFLLAAKEEDVSAGHRSSVNQFYFDVERIYRFDSTSWTTDPNYNIGKSYGQLKWSPFDAEYGAGYIDIGNGLISRTCSSEVPGETSTAKRSGIKCEFPSGQNTKDSHNYFDVQNGGHNFGELFDVRMYVWSLTGSCSPYVRALASSDDDDSGQFRFPGSFGRSCRGAVAVEFHFYERGTLYDLSGNHKNAGELSAEYLAQREREFKGILRVDDIDTNFEGYTATQGVEHLWVTKETDLRVADYNDQYLSLLPTNCTNSTATICKHWIGTEDNDSGESWRNNNAAIWMEFDGAADKPFTLVYTTTGHGSSITSKMTVVNYVLVSEPEDGFYPSLNPLFEAEEAENAITRYDLEPYNIPRINDANEKTIKRFGATTYSWYQPDYHPPGLPAGCSIDGWYTNPELLGARVQDSANLVEVDGKKMMILQNEAGDLGWDSSKGAYFFYGIATCDPVHEVDNSSGCEGGS